VELPTPTSCCRTGHEREYGYSVCSDGSIKRGKLRQRVSQASVWGGPKRTSRPGRTVVGTTCAIKITKVLAGHRMGARVADLPRAVSARGHCRSREPCGVNNQSSLFGHVSALARRSLDPCRVVEGGRRREAPKGVERRGSLEWPVVGSRGR
jgi:hypothetical protein